MSLCQWECEGRSKQTEHHSQLGAQYYPPMVIFFLNMNQLKLFLNKNLEIYFALTKSRPNFLHTSSSRMECVGVLLTRKYPKMLSVFKGSTTREECAYSIDMKIIIVFRCVWYFFSFHYEKLQHFSFLKLILKRRFYSCVMALSHTHLPRYMKITKNKCSE